ncbi:MAG: polyisoprenoid-binding protein [Flavobacteriaceae bacterium]|nr:polyisoprenoid-binding protein [Flavobacteriaceae bacterium]
MASTIKKLSFAVILTAFSVFTINAQDATKWNLDKSHTSVNFSINRFFSEITGKFTDFDGSINFDSNNLKGSKIEFTIAVNSANTANEKRDQHLQSADFFDSKTYPEMTFTSTKFEKKSDTEYSIYGKLTIKDKTKDVILPMKITGEMEHPMAKGVFILSVAINATINRIDYGVGTGNWTTTMVLSDEVKINIPIDLVRKE